MDCLILFEWNAREKSGVFSPSAVGFTTFPVVAAE
jgi:hypothetical protein